MRELYGAALEQDPPTGVLQGAARLTAPLVGADAGAGSELDPAALSHGLYWLSANLAAERPLMLAVDDAQWADVASSPRAARRL